MHPGLHLDPSLRMPLRSIHPSPLTPRTPITHHPSPSSPITANTHHPSRLTPITDHAQHAQRSRIAPFRAHLPAPSFLQDLEQHPPLPLCQISLAPAQQRHFKPNRCPKRHFLFSVHTAVSVYAGYAWLDPETAVRVPGYARMRARYTQ